MVKSDGILFRLSYSREGSFFLEDGVLSKNVKKERKVRKPHKNGRKRNLSQQEIEELLFYERYYENYFSKC